MPAYDESATLMAAVERVLSVDYPCTFELVIVDDGSTDGTTNLLRGDPFAGSGSHR